MRILLFILILFIWAACIEPYILTVKKIQVKDKNLAGLKVVYATDFHYKRYEKLRLMRDVKKINEQNADIILLGGDYVNGHEKGKSLNSAIIAQEFSKLESKYGIYAVLGNHDVWQDAAEISDNLMKNNINVLKNGNKKVGNLYIAGVEDIQTQNPNIDKAMKGAGLPVILISHNPDIIEKVPENVTLTLAGHLHGGQINIPIHGPVIVPSKYGTKYSYGLHNVKNRKLFVSRGIGTSILPLRFYCFPEIVVIEFVK